MKAKRVCKRCISVSDRKGGWMVIPCDKCKTAQAESEVKMSQPENENAARLLRELRTKATDARYDWSGIMGAALDRIADELEAELASRAPATTPTPEVCKCYKDNDYDFYAAVMTGVASEWTVTEDCPIHRDALAAQDKPPAAPTQQATRTNGRPKMSQPENELRAAAERLLGLIWETNFDEEVETEYERAVVALRDALASRAPATPPMPAVEQLIEAARLIDLLSHEDGQPADGFRFREGVQSMRDALIQLGRAPFQDERVAQAAAPGGKERKCGHEYPLLNADCLECAKEIADDSLSRHPLQDKPPRPENEFPTGFPLHEVPSNYAIAARLRAEGKDKPPAAPAIGTIRLVKKDEDIV